MNVKKVENNIFLAQFATLKVRFFDRAILMEIHCDFTFKVCKNFVIELNATNAHKNGREFLKEFDTPFY